MTEEYKLFIFYNNTKGIIMKKLSNKFNYVLSRVDSRTVRLIVTILSLVLFVLAAGAPDAIGGVGM